MSGISADALRGLVRGLRRSSTASEYEPGFDPRVMTEAEANTLFAEVVSALMLNEGLSDAEATVEAAQRHPGINAARTRR